ncbi:hypothetical protein ABZ478_32835 [Streptomyces sp. NPDC005706]|uniref:hypothetical protein n=1 Tax=Streptomyces sp. NPDC005706 TaxID=3157169 RepID=UPI0033EFCF8C
MSVRPIETGYAGHRFRSRLEARWAVFFDNLDIVWEYEPQGYAVGPEGDRQPYLPDFWLPKEKLWVEVKGAEEQLDVELLVRATIPHFGLPNPAGPCWISEHQARLLILGPVPLIQAVPKTGKPAGYIHPAHVLLSFRKGDVFEGWAAFHSYGIEMHPEGGLVGNDGPDVIWHTRGSDWGNWLQPASYMNPDHDDRVQAAYRSARSARFEHGERP